jgi:hypothetical protein
VPRPSHDDHVLRLLITALGLRDVASELRSSGDTDGAAKAIDEAETTERKLSRLLENRARTEGYRAQRAQIAEGSRR